MSEVKISQLPTASSALLADLIPVVQSGVTRKETVQQIVDLVYSSANIEYSAGTLTSSVSVGSGVLRDMGQFTITSSGLYIVIVNVTFGSNATGYRQVELSNSSGGASLGQVVQQAASGAATRLQVVTFVTSPMGILVTAKHTAGTDINLTSSYRYIGLKTL